MLNITWLSIIENNEQMLEPSPGQNSFFFTNIIHIDISSTDKGIRKLAVNVKAFSKHFFSFFQLSQSVKEILFNC